MPYPAWPEPLGRPARGCSPRNPDMKHDHVDDPLRTRFTGPFLAAMLLGALAMLLVAFSGCTLQPLPILAYDERKGAYSDEAMEELTYEMEDGCATWGLDCFADETDESSRGSLVVLLTDALHSGNAGRELSDGPCRKVVWATAGNTAFTHELGHAFGLDHSDDRDNVMWEAQVGQGETTVKQEREVQRRVARFVAGCP